MREKRRKSKRARGEEGSKKRQITKEKKYEREEEGEKQRGESARAHVRLRQRSAHMQQQGMRESV